MFCTALAIVYLVGNEAVSKLSNWVAMKNDRLWSGIDKNTWPPDQSHQFTPLLLVYNEGQQRYNQTSKMANVVYNLDANKTVEELVHAENDSDCNASDVAKVAKNITDILVPLEESDDAQFILIEGAPGIGKSVLLREIACKSGKKELLQTFTLVLLVHLRDPFVQKKKLLISDLLLLFCKREEKAKEVATLCSEHFTSTGGKHLVFLFDGYDEFPKKLQDDSLIADIINRKVLPHCGLVVSTRPHVSVILREQATIKVDILGFNPEEQHHYIENSLKGEPKKIEKLIRYLQDHIIIKNLCLIPINMVILIFLYKKDNQLHSNSATLYNYFIRLTIYRHFIKNNHALKINYLSDLPEPHNTIVQQISKLALHALKENKIVFTEENIEDACPKITDSPEAINGYGLLQAMQHFGYTGETKTFQFLHLSIQEYLAAYYIINNFQHQEELDLLNDYFWKKNHLVNMFSFYIMLTKGQRAPFTEFLSGGKQGVAISKDFLDDQLKCFRLYFYFKEAKNSVMCKSIEEAEKFSKSEIDVHGTKLSTTDLECMCVFLTTTLSLQKQPWKQLNLCNCSIQDCDFHIVHAYLNHSVVKIEKLYLNNNFLTTLSSSYVSEIVISCKIELLSLSSNKTIGQDEKLYTMLTHPSSVLAVLYMSHTTLSSIAVGKLFAAVKDSDKLKLLTIEHCGITDNAAKDITAALSINKSLVRLRMSGNDISGEVMMKIIKALSSNKILKYLHVPGYSREIGDSIRSLEQEINAKRKYQRVRNELKVYLL